MARYILKSTEETIRLGELLGRRLKAPVVINLHGEMGVGKTHLTKGIARGLGVEGEITSPTFTLANYYDEGRLPFYHIDAYRLESLEEAVEAGLEEIFLEPAVVVVEWAELLEPLFDNEVLDIWIERTGDHERELVIEGVEDDLLGN